MNRFIREMKQYRKYILYAGMSELKAEVANSYLNWLWWIVEPICFMLIYSLVFGLFFGSKIEHINVFVYIGILMWDYFNKMVNSSVQLIRHNKAIVAKVYLPKYILLFIKMYVNLFKLMIKLVILLIMIIVVRIPFTPYMLWAVPLILTMMTFTFAVCTFLMHFGVYVDDLANVVRIFLRMMFYLTGVFYDVRVRAGKTLGARLAGIIVHANPMANVIVGMRDAIMDQRTPDVKYMVIWFLLGLVFSVLGIRLIYKNENNYVKVI